MKESNRKQSENLIAFIFINKDYVVQWETTKALQPLFENRKYIAGEICYKTAFNCNTPCETCPLTKMFASHEPASAIYEEHGISIETVASPVFDGKGEIMGGILKIEDVTKRIRQDREIKRLNVLMDTILNNVPMYMYLKDPNDEFRYLYWNKATADNTKIPASKVLGKTDWDIFPNKEDAMHCYKSDLELLENGDRVSTFEEYLTAEGEKRMANTVKMLIPNDKEIPWILGMSWDVTELKKTEKELIIAKEKAEESNRLKSAFLANMSHEIRTPLNAIVGFSDLLVETNEVGEKKEYINLIKKNNELLLQLISDILDLSKIEAQTLEFTYENVDINGLCLGIIAASNLKIDAKVPVLFGDHIDECYVYSDRNRISQVISNLVNNALKFTSTGSIKVGYHIIHETEIEFYVEDTGTGIPGDQKKRIFDRFVKLDTFTQGTGLGLPICKSIIEQLKGSIGVDSIVGKGSRFWFTLPYDKNRINTSDKDDKNLRTAVTSSTESPGRQHILIAEDIDSNYFLLQCLLQEKYDLSRAYNGKEAVELCKQEKPDIILMDIEMPVMNGLEATQEIRTFNSYIPIVALTAYAYDSDVQKALAAGCDDFLTKPISIPALKKTIAKFMD